MVFNSTIDFVNSMLFAAGNASDGMKLDDVVSFVMNGTRVDKFVAVQAFAQWLSMWAAQLYAWTRAHPAALQLFLLGFRFYVVGHIVSVVYHTFRVLVKFVRNTSFVVVSAGTGYDHRNARRAAWRLTSSVEDNLGLTTRFVRYATGLMVVLGELFMVMALLSQATDVTLNNRTVGETASGYVLWTFRSVVLARPLRAMYEYPDVVFGVLPCVWLISWLTRATYSVKAQMSTTVTTTVIVGGERSVSVRTWSASSAVTAVFYYSGIVDLSRYFLAWRDLTLRAGFREGARVLWADVVDYATPMGWYLWVRMLFRIFTWPLMCGAAWVAAFDVRPMRRLTPEFDPAIVDGGRRAPVFVRATVDEGPPMPVADEKTTVTGLLKQTEPVKNRIVETSLLPAVVPLGIATGSLAITGGDDMPLAGTIRDPKFLVKLPMKPVSNNEYFVKFLDMIEDGPLVRELTAYARVPPNPWNGLMEIGKFRRPVFQTIETNCRNFLIRALLHATGLENARIPFLDLFKIKDLGELLSSEARKHHPGWVWRANGHQTKDEAFPNALAYAKKSWLEALAGDFGFVEKHAWLALPVVKKNASRKPELEARTRLALIPELDYVLIMACMLKKVVAYVEDEGHGRWLSKFELFRNNLWKVATKFRHVKIFGQCDMSDMGASLSDDMCDVVCEFLGRVTVAPGGVSSYEWWRAMLVEGMVRGKIAVPVNAADDPRVHVFQTRHGGKDGQYQFNFISSCVMVCLQAYGVWRQFRAIESRNPGVYRDAFDAFQAIVGEVHGDNCTFGYPEGLDFLHPTDENSAKCWKELGYTVKVGGETFLTRDWEQVAICSWQVGWVRLHSSSAVRAVGWKPTADGLKGLLYPERLIDYDAPSSNDLAYVFELTSALYILNFWNLESRRLLELFWEVLQDVAGKKIETEFVRFTHVKDWLYKTGEVLTLQDISWSAPRPYPEKKLTLLWLNTDLEIDTEQQVSKLAPDVRRTARAVRAFDAFRGPIAEAVLGPLNRRDPTTAMLGAAAVGAMGVADSASP